MYTPPFPLLRHDRLVHGRFTNTRLDINCYKIFEIKLYDAAYGQISGLLFFARYHFATVMVVVVVMVERHSRHGRHLWDLSKSRGDQGSFERRKF